MSHSRVYSEVKERGKGKKQESTYMARLTCVQYGSRIAVVNLFQIESYFCRSPFERFSAFVGLFCKRDAAI